MKKFLKTGVVSLALIASFMPQAYAEPVQYTFDKTPVLELAVLPSSTLFDMKSTRVPETTIFGLPVNEGPIDRSLRAAVAIGLIGTGVYGLSTGAISTPISATLLGVSAIPALTAATGYCPLYSLFGVEYTF